jgi:hypothetical protein
MTHSTYLEFASGEHPLCIPKDAVVYRLWDGRTFVYTVHPELVQRAEYSPGAELVQ